jgi:Arc/MetJ family transcription regulator
MRTTLTLDDDVAAAIERLRQTREASFEDLVNEALRRGLKEMAEPRKTREPRSARGRSRSGLRSSASTM